MKLEDQIFNLLARAPMEPHPKGASLQLCTFKASRRLFLLAFDCTFWWEPRNAPRSRPHAPRLKGLFVREGWRPWSGTFWPAVFTQTPSRSTDTHTHTPEREPSDGLLQGPRRGYPGIRLFAFTALACMCERERERQRETERETPVSHRPDKQPSVPARWLCSSFC